MVEIVEVPTGRKDIPVHLHDIFGLNFELTCEIICLVPFGPFWNNTAAIPIWEASV